jgi:hypothetical protein
MASNRHHPPSIPQSIDTTSTSLVTIQVQNLLFSASKPLTKLGLTSSFAGLTGITNDQKDELFGSRK